MLRREPQAKESQDHGRQRRSHEGRGKATEEALMDKDMATLDQVLTKDTWKDLLLNYNKY